CAQVKKDHKGGSQTDEYGKIRAQLVNEGRTVSMIAADGNCFFRTLSTCLYGNDLNYASLRKTVIEFVQKHQESFEAMIENESVLSYIQKMSKDGFWATTTEIFAISTILQTDVYVLSPYRNHRYEWLMFQPLFQHESLSEDLKCNHVCKYLTLCHTNQNHFDFIKPINTTCNCGLPRPQLEGTKPNSPTDL
ncbi:hypothetical protein BgiMline_025480, partial [Biomphalaria glabrata]